MAKKTKKPLDYKQFLDSLKNNDVSPVYIFYGEEEYFISEALQELRTYLTEKFGELDYMSLDRNSSSLSDMIYGTKSQSLFGSRKLYVVKDCDKFSKEENTSMESYLNNPGNSTCLILIYTEAKKIKLNTDSKTVLVSFPRDDRNYLVQLRRIVEKRGYKITNDALGLLADFVGNNLIELSNEINKLMLFLKDRKEINKSDIKNYIRRSNYKNTFELINAVCNKDRKLALKVLIDLEEKREEPIAILNRISWRVRLIWQVKQLTEQGISKKDITSKLKISAGNLYYVEKQCRNFSHQDIKRVLKNIYSTDLKLKSTQLPAYEILTNTVIEMCK
jgi:DNA polymerase III subunit delta